MRHDDMRQPFTVQGDLPFVLRAFGMPDDMAPEKAHDAFSDYVARTCTTTGKTCMITTWHAVTVGGGTTYTVQAEPIRLASSADPWVKVGTTTIDGFTDEQFGDEVGCSFDYFLTSDHPVRVGGRYLKGRGSRSFEGRTMLFCDIVRRQSEIDAEHLAAQMKVADEHSQMMAKAFAKTCPECGPHGNRGEVLLASSWAKCTTCAGGKPGDLWGEVQVEPSLPTGTVRRSHDIDPRARRTMVYFASGRTETFDVPAGATRISIDDDNETVEFNHQAASEAHRPGGGFPDDKFSIKESPDLSGPLTVTIGGRGFKVPTISEMHGAALDNLYLYLCGEPDGMSREEYRRIMFGEWVP